MNPQERRHNLVHKYNPQINYILIEDCPYCKLQKRLNYGNTISLNRMYNRRRNQDTNETNIDNQTVIRNSNIVQPNNNLSNRINYNNINRNYTSIYSNNSFLNRLVTRHTPYRTSRYINNLSRFNTTIFNRNVPNISQNNDYENYTDLEDVKLETSLTKVNNNSDISITTNNSDFCAICQENLPYGSIIRKLTCGHLYHQYCIDKWLEYNVKCPLCNNELN